jgi:hypothetical protein
MEPEDSLPQLQMPVFIMSQINPTQAPIPLTEDVLILSTHLSLFLPNGLFLSCFPNKTLYTPLLTPTCYMLRPSHSFQYDHPNNIW